MNEFEELKNEIIKGLNGFLDVIKESFEPKVIYRVYRVKGNKKRRYLFRHNRLLDAIPLSNLSIIHRFIGEKGKI